MNGRPDAAGGAEAASAAVEASRAAPLWVVKSGSSILTEEIPVDLPGDSAARAGDAAAGAATGRGLARAAFAAWAEQIAALHRAGRRFVIVSSGAVAAGMQRLGWRVRPETTHAQQAAAAVGQMGLIEAWESCFARHGLHTAQILLTHEDISDRRRYLNARATVRTLLDMGVIPVVNENDTVVVDEIRVGDNDTLAALAANLLEADLLVILTDQPGMYERDPRTDPAAALLRRVAASDPRLDAMAGAAAAAGRGGMRTKVIAARQAARSATPTRVAPGRMEGVLRRIAAGEEIGTLFVPDEKSPLAARKRWLLGRRVCGRLTLDDGAVRMLRESGRSLLAIGVTALSGEFRRGDLVVCVDAAGRETARGLINYAAAEARRILGQPSRRIEEILGYVNEAELIHRDNLALV